jgi:transcription elongation factor Elf1
VNPFGHRLLHKQAAGVIAMTVHVAELVLGPLLQLRCPRCEHLHEDDYESIDGDVIGEMRCEACGTNFGFVVALCPGCEAETAFTWRATASPPVYRNWACTRCRMAPNKHETNDLHSHA